MPHLLGVAENPALPDTRQVIDGAILEKYFVDEWGSDPELLGVELDKEQVQNAYVPYEDIPEASRARLENLARSEGLRVNEDLSEKPTRRFSCEWAMSESWKFFMAVREATRFGG